MTEGRRGGPLEAAAEVVSTRPAGAHRHVTLRAPGIADGFRPGNFVAVSIGEPPRTLLARRPFWIHRVTAGTRGDTVELVVTPRGPGSRWLAESAPGTRVALSGPLGRPFALPAEPVTCVLVGEAYGAAPLFPLAERLHERGCTVHLLLAGADDSHLIGARDLRRIVRSVTVVTLDGSMGQVGRVADVLPDLLSRTGADVVYAGGPAGTLHDVAAAAEAHGAWSQVALERPQPCGTGLCRGCAVPVVGEDGVARTVRGCHEGPVFRGDRVRWVDL